MIHCLSCNRKNSPKLAISKPTTLLVLSFLLGILEGYLKDARFIGCAKALLKGQYVSRAPLKGPTPSLFQNNLKYNFCLKCTFLRFFLAGSQKSLHICIHNCIKNVPVVHSSSYSVEHLSLYTVSHFCSYLASTM